MILFHVTTHASLPGILREGLRPDKSQTVRQGTWLCESARRMWACMHVANRHRVDLRDVRILRVDVPSKDLKFVRNGLCLCEKLIGPECIQSVSVLGITTEGREGRSK